MVRFRTAVLALAAGALCLSARAEVMNLKVVTDANPDYYDLPSLVRSATSKWKTPEEKCWAMFYWNHIGRRQTSPMQLHGMELTDPIRQFNDYGFTMCSTVSGVNQSIWEAMGLKHKFWDISNHTVCEVEYGGRYHCYDNSLSAIYTLCDGVTIAGVEDIGKDGACPTSNGQTEAGHIAKYHCLTATSPNGFLIGADTARSLTEEFGCFNPKGLKFRYYYYNWDYGHRYILNLKSNEVYTRYHHKLGDEPEFYVPNPDGRPGGKDPESVNKRYRIRANGIWSFKPDLGAAYKSALHDSENIAAAKPAGLQPARTGAPAKAVFKVQGANVITGQKIKAALFKKGDADQASISVSSDNGLHWKEAWKADAAGNIAADVKLVGEVNGAYEVLVKVEMSAAGSPADVALKSLEIETTTMVNTKTQPRLTLGKNTIYVGAGEQTDSIVFWPELEKGHYKDMVVEESNVTAGDHCGYTGVLHPVNPKEDGWVVYKLDAPRDITLLTYGGRFYNRAPNSHMDIFHSTDGKTWTKSWSITDTGQPWDVIHYETVQIPKGNRSVWVKYLMNTPSPDDTGHGASIYAVRMEVNHEPVEKKTAPVEVTFAWKEVQQDRSIVERSHAQLVDKLPFRYTIDVGGADHPVMESLRVNLKGAAPDVKYGYSDGKDAGGEKFIPKWVKYGRNVAVGKSYTCSVPSGNNWEAGDPDGKKLTDGVVGPPYSGGIAFRWGGTWDKPVVIDLDLGAETECASFGFNANGYPWWDALKGEVKDEAEVLVSSDGKEYKPLGLVKTDIRWVDVPINHMVPDDEHLQGCTFRLIPEKPVKARYVRFNVKPKRNIDITELEVLDSIKFEPFDMRIALPDEK